MFRHAMRGECLKPSPLKPYMTHDSTYDDHLVWPIHVPRSCEPLITPHLSLWGNARTRATFPTHKKATIHIHRGEGEDGYITLGGGGGGACQTWIIYTYEYAMYTISFYSQIKGFKVSVGPLSCNFGVARFWWSGWGNLGTKGYAAAIS